METRSAGTKPPDPQMIGLLLVHGIGAQESGDTTSQFVAGILRAFPEAHFNKDTRTLSVESRLIRLYEVYWADLLKKENKGSFNQDLMTSVTWLPWLHYRAGSYSAGDYSFVLVLFRTLVLVPVGVIFQLMYQGARLLAAICQAIRDSAKTDSGSSGTRPPSEAAHSSRFSWRRIKATADEAKDRRTVLDEILDEYAGDVFTYVDSAGGACREGSQFVHTAGQVHGRFYAALNQASDDGCSEIQIVAHSLGTVVTHLALSGHNLTRFRQEEQQPETSSLEPLAQLTRLYTIGSPLEKIRFVWPKLITTDLIGRMRFVGERAEVLSTTSFQAAAYRMKWDNFYDPFDKISGKLKRFDHWGGVTNHRLLGLGGPLRSHVNYQSSRGFLTVISEGLAGKKVTVKNSLPTRVRNVVLSLGENLLVLVAVPITFLIGLAMVLFLAGGIAYLLGLLVGLFASEHATNVFKDVTMLFLAASLVLAFTIGGRVRASEARKKYWTVRGPDEAERAATSMAARN